MINIKDIAKKAGVSISTVSYALNGSTRVSEKTRQRILKIANELNYIPNASGRNLKKRETNVIGVFIEDYSGSYFGQLFFGMREALNARGYELIVCSGHQSRRFIPERMIDGALILDATFPDEEVIHYAERGHKLVVLDREVEHPNINQILLNNYKGAKLAIEHFIENKLHHIYVVKGENYDGRKRLQSVRQTLSQYLHVDYTEITGSFNQVSGQQAAKQIVQEYTQPVGVFCFNDEMAIGIYNYLQQTNLRVGQHIHIIGFDNIELAAFTQPRLTTIDYSRRKWGALASESLLNMIENKPVEPTIIDVTFIKGQSVGMYID